MLRPSLAATRCNFSAVALDQFGNAFQPTFNWSVVSGGVGTISGSGLYTAPAAGTGVATVRATLDGVSGTASVTVEDAGVADHDFAQPPVGTGPSAYEYDPSDSPWTFTGTAGVAGNSSLFTAGNPNAPQGTQVAFLQEYGTVSQTVTLAAGNYNLSFVAAQRGSGNASSQTFAVEFDGNPLGYFTPAGSNYAAYNTITFVASAGAHTISFVGIDPDGLDNTALLDQVRISPVVVGYGFELASIADGTYQVAPAGTPLTWAGNAGIAANGSALGNPDARRAATSLSCWATAAASKTRRAASRPAPTA